MCHVISKVYLGDEPQDRDGPRLADPVRAVDRLAVDFGVEVRVVEDHL